MPEKFCSVTKILKSRQGFTLIESLISIMLIALIAIVSAGLIAYFAKYTKQDLTSTCLLQAASSGLEAKRANPSVDSIQVICGAHNVNVTMTGNPPTAAPLMGSQNSACAEVVSTSAIGSKTMVLKDFVCNFPEG
ncbi:MAG: type IV pilus modification PilV family protein [Smithellaceae bacterium]